MKIFICPVSNQRISRHVVRLTGLMIATMIALYVLTDNIVFIIAITVDHFIRAFTSWPNSPFSWVAAQIVQWFNSF